MKNVMLIAPTFFGYYKEIIKELELMEYGVDYFSDTPCNSSLYKAISRINKKIVKPFSNSYYKKEIEPKIKNKKYDYILLIVGMSFSLSKEIFIELKKKNPKAKFIIYQWDGEKNIKFIKKYHYLFDDIYTFDRLDCQTNEKYKFLPLFYIKNYEEVGEKKNTEYKYDASYVGTAHPQKIYMINKMSEELKDKLPNQFIYHYMPSKFKYIYHKIFSKEYKNVKYSDLKKEKISSDKMMEIFQNSKCIFDSPQAGQNGLTIRTIECLGSKKKIITCNSDIVNYDFYNSKNIYIYGEKNNDDFFKCEYEEIPEKVYKKYSIKNWILTVLEGV